MALEQKWNESLITAISKMTQQNEDEVRVYIQDPTYLKKIEEMAKLRKETAEDVLQNLKNISVSWDWELDSSYVK